MEGEMVRRLVEKPVRRFLINAGIYILEPSLKHQVRRCRLRDMTQLVSGLAARGWPVAGFPVRECWIDIGTPEDYERARRTAGNGL
jgi:NDP-sugar pyrophosphorylase family protein